MTINGSKIGKLLFILVSVFTVLALQIDTGYTADSSWNAKYWNNQTLSGDPVLVRQESSLEYDWGQGSPAPGIVNANSFSARWERAVDFSAGTYRFRITTDDGMRLWIDQVLVIDSWTDSQVHAIETDYYLASGEHQIRVQYYDAGGAAVAKLNWWRVDGVQPTGTWLGEYYNNKNLSGTPAFTRYDQRIDFNFGGGSPGAGVAADQFSVRWTNNLSVSAGRYRFTVKADDGVRLWVNNQLLIDRWFNQAATYYNAEVALAGGTIPVRMEYYEDQGGAEALLSWVPVAGAVPLFESWRGDYFTNANLSGAPALSRDDPSVLSFNWENGSPAPGLIGPDNFSARWTRTININPGLYRFTATSDDGIRVWVNDQLLINAWSDHQSTIYFADITLPGGQIPLKVEYYDRVGLAEVRLSWSTATAPAPTPANPTGTATSARLNLRSSPLVANNIVTQISRGTVVRLLARNEASTWVKVVLADNRQGWVYAPLLSTTVPVSTLPLESTPAPASAGNTATVRAYRLNVRTGPGTTNSVITSVPLGTVVTLLGRNADATWVRVIIPDTRQGWVYAGLIASSTPIAGLPIVP